MYRFIRSIAHTTAILYRRYVYSPRVAKRADTRRFTRVFILVCLSASSLFLYAYMTDQLPNMPLLGKDKKVVIDNASIIQQSNHPVKQVQQQVAAKYYKVSVLSTSDIRAHELANRLEKNQKKLNKLQQEYQQQLQHNQLQREKQSTIASSSLYGSPSKFYQYELGIERRLEQAGRDLYALSYNSSGLDGLALVRLVVESDGALRKAEIIQSSGSRKIDKLLISSVRKAAPFAAFPDEMDKDSFVLQRYLHLTP